MSVLSLKKTAPKNSDVMSNFKLYIPQHYSQHEKYISFRQSGVYLSSGFMSAISFTPKWIRFFNSDTSYLFGFELLNERKPGVYKLQRGDLRNKGVGFRADKLITDHEVLKMLLKDQSGERERVRFPITYDAENKLYTFTVIPSFEKRCKREDVPNVSGIYRYRNTNGEVIYIGMGNIKERLKASPRREWDINSVEYSVLDNKEDMSKYESFHIDDYVKQNGRKPIYNMIGGKSSNPSADLSALS